jgi:glucose/arabinose dehydrogenase
VIVYGTNYDGTLIDGALERENGSQAEATGAPGKTAASGMEQPRYYWDPAIAPSGITFYDGKLVSEWKGNLFVAALAGQHVSRLILKDNKVVGEERLLMDQHQRVRDVQEGPDGALWVITDEADGRLIQIAP